MAVNKVIYDGTVLMDISNSTVSPETLLEGTVAYNSKGEKIVGTMKQGFLLLGGTFEFSDTYNEYDKEAGFANNTQTVGGYFGLVSGEEAEELMKGIV